MHGGRWKDSEVHDIETVVDGDDVQELVEIFLEKYRHDGPVVWFEKSKDVLGIDTYASDFPVSKGYKIHEEEEADVLLTRLEDLNDRATEAFKDFLNVDNLTLVNTDIGSQKDYADIHRTLNASIVFPEAYVNTMCSSNSAQHFYSKAEIDRFRAEWSKNRP